MTPGPAEALPAQLVETLLHATEEELSHVHLHALVDLVRPVTRGELEAAAGAVMEAFPVLGCRFQASWWRDRWLRWSGEVAELVHVERVDDGDLHDATRRQVERRFDHTRAPTWRLAFLEHGAGGRLVVSLHHMTGDGGGLKAVTNVVAAALCGVPPDPPPSPSRSMLTPARGLRLRDLPVLALEFVREGLQPLSVLRVRRLPRVARGGEDKRPIWRTVTLQGEPARRFVERCKASGATINDGLVAAALRLAARRGARGPVAAGYTVDLRRYLQSPMSVVTNLHGVALVVLPRRCAGSGDEALAAVSARIGVQKRRLPGLAYTLLPVLALSWLPHGLLRRVGGLVLRSVLRNLDRALAVTNVGSLDETLAPFGDAVVEASFLGPFVHGLPVPVIIASGFRGSLTLHVEGTEAFAPEALEAFASELREELGG